jgi:hypothetical protein
MVIDPKGLTSALKITNEMRRVREKQTFIVARAVRLHNQGARVVSYTTEARMGAWFGGDITAENPGYLSP